MEPKDRYITSRNFDIGDGEIGRVFRFIMMNKLVPLGYFAGGTTLKILMILLFVHRLGRPLFRCIIPQEARLTRIYVKFRKSSGNWESGKL